jgi:hypothetical protein
MEGIGLMKLIQTGQATSIKNDGKACRSGLLGRGGRVLGIHDGLLHFPAGFEERGFPFGYADLFAGLGIAGNAGLPFLDAEGPETAEFDPVVLIELFDGFAELINEFSNDYADFFPGHTVFLDLLVLEYDIDYVGFSHFAFTH